MKIGTKSVLFGVHQFAIHPWFVAWAWWKLYGFPFDPRLWVAFFVHDLGYLGMPNMDGPEGEEHPMLGAEIMRRLFDREPYDFDWMEYSFGQHGVFFRAGRESNFNLLLLAGWELVSIPGNFAVLKQARYHWHDFCLLHSRYYAKKLNMPFIRLCVADKLSFVLTPRWLYMLLARATGELNEYLKNAQHSESEHWKPTGFDANVWHAALKVYMSKWVEEHKGGKVDTWTSVDRHARDSTGVWQ